MSNTLATLETVLIRLCRMASHPVYVMDLASGFADLVLPFCIMFLIGVAASMDPVQRRRDHLCHIAMPYMR